MRVGSLFSGIEGFGLGFEQAGAEIIWQVEQDKFCNAVLATHWPSVQRFTDVRSVGRRNLAPVDCITAGVPCQDVSIAGQRKGLAGKRTGLFYEFARILRELRPAWFVFENVPGLFSSNQGRDFAEVLRVLMVECGYGVSWRVLDSRYFNVAQRRERVFIVGCFGKPCPAEILFESESGAGDSAAGGETREDIAVPLTSGSGVTGNKPGRRCEDDFNIVRQAMSSKWSKGSSGPAGDEHHNLVLAKDVESGRRRISFDVAASLRESDGHHGRSSPRGDGCDNIFAIQDVRGRRDKRQNGIGISESDTMYSLTKVDRHAVAFAENQRGELRTSTIAPQLSAGGGKPGSGYSAALCAAPHSDRVRDFASLPKGMDSPRYRALGNAVTASVAYWIAKRMMRVD